MSKSGRNSGSIRIDQADKYFSLYIRYRDKWACQRCFKEYAPLTTSLQCSHFMGRRKENTRFEPLNCDALCFGCHQYFTSHPAEHYEWQIKQKGKDIVEQIILWSNQYKRKQRELEALYWQQRLFEDYGIRQ